MDLKGLTAVELGKKIQAKEVTVKEAVEAGADIIMLDNMTNEDMAKAVEMTNGKALLEASGNVTSETIRAIAETGVDIISIGAITHSVKAFDISMKMEK